MHIIYEVHMLIAHACVDQHCSCMCWSTLLSFLARHISSYLWQFIISCLCAQFSYTHDLTDFLINWSVNICIFSWERLSTVHKLPTAEEKKTSNRKLISLGSICRHFVFTCVWCSEQPCNHDKHRKRLINYNYTYPAVHVQNTNLTPWPAVPHFTAYPFTPQYRTLPHLRLPAVPHFTALWCLFRFVSRKTCCSWRIWYIFISLEPEKFTVYTGVNKNSNIVLKKVS